MRYAVDTILMAFLVNALLFLYGRQCSLLRGSNSLASFFIVFAEIFTRRRPSFEVRIVILYNIRQRLQQFSFDRGCCML